jgi:CheY-like chemotaxis protein
MGSRILLADDSITIQKVVNLTFADEGIEVVAVSNGDLAERRLSEVKPDLVLADIFMPGKNGYELCETIKQNPQFRNVPVVLLVGAFEPFDQNEARRVGADAHLTKPFESRTLVETVRRLIDASGHTNPVPPAPALTNEPNAVSDAGLKPPPLTAPPAAKLDLSAMMVDRKAAPVTSSTRNTGELASPSPVTVTETFEPEGTNAGAHEWVNSPLAAAGEADAPFEMPSIGEFQSDSASPIDMDNQDMILDFEKSEPFESSAPLSPGYFETEGSDLLGLDSSGASEQAEWFSRDSFETRALETPSGAEARQASTSPFTNQPLDLGVQAKAAFEPASGLSESAQATLLAVDDPLGDVLLDNPLSPGMMQSPNDSLDIAFTEGAVAQGVPSTQFDLVETVENSSQQVSVEPEQNTLWHEAAGAEETIPLNNQPANYAPDSRTDWHPPLDGISDSLDWTSPRAGVYSTAQLDSVMMPIDTAEYLRAHSTNNDAQQTVNSEEPAFEAAALWPEEETRFSAIDIEAFPVEEPAAVEEAVASPEPLGAAETGFSLSSVAAEQPDENDSTPARARTDGSGVSEPKAAELSSAAIDEIVRRVVAEMSSSVVREVAWEVVPDCVERVIDQLTRESLSRRV